MTISFIDDLCQHTDAINFIPGTTKLKEIEHTAILKTFEHLDFNRAHTALALGIGLRTLQRKLKRYGVSHWGKSHHNGK